MELLTLDEKKAKEIMSSTGVIEVLYEGAVVWIDVIKDNGKALVHYISNNKKAEVPISELVETQKGFQ